MPEYRLRHTIWGGLIKSIVDASNTTDLTAMTEDTATYATSVLGALIGSPLGLFPFVSQMGSAGFGKLLEMNAAKVFETARLNPQQVVQLWLRKYSAGGTVESWFEDLSEQGWAKERIEAIKELAKVLPAPADIIRFAVREAYTPEIAEKFGQYEDFPDKAMDDAGKVGLTKEQFLKFWAAHWELPSTQQGYEMYHRGIITYEELKTLLRALDVMPFWRDKLIQMSANVITRVDARRMWDMRVIDDDKLLSIYIAQGYSKDDAQALTTWTKVYQTLPDLIARYKNGWIKGEDITIELVKLGLSEAAATDLYQQKIKNPNQKDRMGAEKDLAKSDIVAGYKRGVLTAEDATKMLQELNYDAEEAAFIVKVNTPIPTQPKRDLTATDITSGVASGILGYDEAKKYLLYLGYDDWECTYLLKLHAPKVVKGTAKDLTKAEIVKAWKAGIFPDDTAIEQLMKAGYDEDEAIIILAINTSKS